MSALGRISTVTDPRLATVRGTGALRPGGDLRRPDGRHIADARGQKVLYWNCPQIGEAYDSSSRSCSSVNTVMRTVDRRGCAGEDTTPCLLLFPLRTASTLALSLCAAFPASRRSRIPMRGRGHTWLVPAKIECQRGFDSMSSNGKNHHPMALVVGSKFAVRAPIKSANSCSTSGCLLPKLAGATIRYSSWRLRRSGPIQRLSTTLPIMPFFLVKRFGDWPIMRSYRLGCGDRA